MKKKEIISLFLFLFLILILIMDNTLIVSNEVLIAADLGIYFDIIGIMLGIYTIIHGIAILSFGYLSDIVTRKKLLIVAGFLWGITALFHILITEVWQLFFARIVAAIATGVTAPLSISYLADIIPSTARSKAFAFWSLISTVGYLIAGSFALSFNQIPYEELEAAGVSENLNYIIINYSHLVNTWRYPFFYLGILALFVSFLNIFFTIEPKRGAKDKGLEPLLKEERYQYSYKIKFSDLKFIFVRKSNFFLILNFFDVIASGLLTAFIFPYINLEMGISFSDPKGLLAIGILLAFIIPLALFIGQFGLAHWGDKKVQNGDLSGRVKVATICGILNLPFLIVAFLMSPNVSRKTFFFDTFSTGGIEFWLFWIIFSLLLGIGLAFSFGIAPNWYSSLVDVNLPEHRGTMVAIASFVDTFGRAFGAVLGGFIVTTTNSFSTALFWSTLIFGIVSTCFWLPLFLTCQKDFNAVAEILKERAEKLKEKE
ncbi:MAG: MFS transporter [Promethearchaeota archaeon]